MTSPALLTDPFLQLPTANSVRVVWFTEFAGTQHLVSYGEGLSQTVAATTTQLSRTREDQHSYVGQQTRTGEVYQAPVRRPIWRHEAEVTGLVRDRRLPYRVSSLHEDGQWVHSETFTLAAQPSGDRPLKILLTSDHQLKPMVAANLQKMAETIGSIDAVFFAGDAVNVADRTSEWFDDTRGGAFFPCLQGRAQVHYGTASQPYQGAPLLQHVPFFPTLGNHEVMGRFSLESLEHEFDSPYPRWAALQLYNPEVDGDRTLWLKNHAYNTDTYEEIFSLPDTSPGGKQYYAFSFGTIRLVSLYAANIWRWFGLEQDKRSKYRERVSDYEQPENWGYGQLIFEPIAKGSAQYQWLEQELQSPEFQTARYRIVMLHHPPHSLGGNSVPPYTDPIQRIERDDQGNVTSIVYDYPPEDDYLLRDVVPLLEAAGVQLVLYGHTHVWNRFVSPRGLHFLETSNVGNSYGAFCFPGQTRKVPEPLHNRYTVTGNPGGLAPVVPAIAPLLNHQGEPMPYLSSNDITAFTILDTGTGKVTSYRFNTQDPEAGVIPFDEFQLIPSQS